MISKPLGSHDILSAGIPAVVPPAPMIVDSGPWLSCPPSQHPRARLPTSPEKLSKEAILTCHKCLLLPPPRVVIITHRLASTTLLSQGEQLSTAVDIAVYKPISSQRKPLFFFYDRYMILRILLNQASQALRNWLCISLLFSAFPHTFLCFLQVFSSLPKKEVKNAG